MKKLVVLVLLSIALVGCGNNSADIYSLPSGATNITDVGNGWVEYTYKSNRILYYSGYAGNHGYMTATVISE